MKTHINYSILIFFSILLTIIYSCQSKKNSYVTLSGSLLKPDDSIVIKNSFNEQLLIITANTTERFKDTISVKEGYYIFQFNNDNSSIYLKPGDNLIINQNNKKGNLEFSEKGNEVLSYLQKKIGIDTKIKTFLDKNEVDYLKAVRQGEKEKLNLLGSYKKGLNASFITLEKKRIDLETRIYLSSYIKKREQVDKDFKTSSDYPDFFYGLNFNDESLMKIPGFISFIGDNLLFRSIKERPINPNFVLNTLSKLDSLVTNSRIKQEVAYSLKYLFKYNTDYESTYKKMSELIKSEEYQENIDTIYEELTELTIGKPSPNFSFKNTEDKIVKLEDLKGKPVYIDVWATWCAPCIKEFPSLKKMQNLFQDKIHFVSICTDGSQKKEKWKSLLTQFELEGVQLFSKNLKDPFFKKYNVVTIPRFILLDKSGIIVQKDALRPSEEGLNIQFQKLLN